MELDKFLEQMKLFLNTLSVKSHHVPASKFDDSKGTSHYQAMQVGDLFRRTVDFLLEENKCPRTRVVHDGG